MNWPEQEGKIKRAKVRWNARKKEYPKKTTTVTLKSDARGAVGVNLVFWYGSSSSLWFHPSSSMPVYMSNSMLSWGLLRSLCFLAFPFFLLLLPWLLWLFGSLKPRSMCDTARQSVESKAEGKKGQPYRRENG
jgi:hypothetical protein